MLMNFIVKNFRSFKDETILNLTATNDPMHKNHVKEDLSGKKTSLLRAAAIYGANASGKSNIIEAIFFAQEFVLNKTKLINVNPFKLNPKCRKLPSKFEFVFKYQGILYTYGFAINTERVLEERLCAYPKTKEVLYYERFTDKKNETRIELGPSLAPKNSKLFKQLKLIAEIAKPNQLLLSELHERRIARIIPVFNWFDNTLTIIGPNDPCLSLAFQMHKNKEFAGFVSSFLQNADTGIETLETKHYPIDEFFKDSNEINEIRKDLTSGNVNAIILESGNACIVKNEKGKEEVIEIYTRHKDMVGGTIEFNLDEESDGSKRLMHLIPTLIMSRIQNHEHVFVIDELNRSLHPLLSRFYLKSYLEKKDTYGGQLIFTTHDTNLLDLELLRRDEIYFIEKDRNGASHISSLSDYKIRSDLKVQKGYLEGRFGAIPFLGDVSKIGLS